MIKNKNPQGSYQENTSNKDYSRLNVSGKGQEVQASKPREELNQEHIKRGVLEEYSTDSCDVPPWPATPYIGIDWGQSSPKFIRPTMYRVPSNYTLHKTTNVPFGLIIQPMADISENENYLPKAEWGSEGPVRWSAWGGYVNPGTVFLENGTKARCNFCWTIFEVADTKYSFISDKSSLPELYYGSYEFDVCGKYVYYESKYPVYLFIIDITNDSFVNGLFKSVIEFLKNTLDSIPNPANTNLCFLTVDEYVQWYRFPEDFEKGPIVYNVSDMYEPFLPVPVSELMLNLQKDRTKIDLLLEKLRKNFNKFNL